MQDRLFLFLQNQYVYYHTEFTLIKRQKHKQMNIKKKHLVLSVLFILPLFAYMFFASGVYNFAKLDTVQDNVLDASEYPLAIKDSTITFEGKITILSFLGADVKTKKAYAFNLKEKIYDKNKDFNDLQFVSLVTPGQEAELISFKNAIDYTSESDKWFFVELNENRIQSLFESLKTNLTLDEYQSTSHVFIIDKERKLRGRLEDEDGSIRYGYNMASVAELSDEMKDDVKVILAEYRLALKKYNEENTEDK